MNITQLTRSKYSLAISILASDLILTFFAWYCAVWISFNFTLPTAIYFHKIVILSGIVIAIHTVSYWKTGLHRTIWHYASVPDVIRIVKAVVIGTLILSLTYLAFKENYLPYSTFPLFALIAIFFLAGGRLFLRWHKYHRSSAIKDAKKVLVIGAGNASERIIRELQRANDHIKDFLPIGLIDDDPKKLGIEIHGIRVLGDTNQLTKLVQKYQVELILIAIPSATAAQMRKIVSLCEQTGISYRTLPTFNDIALGRAQLTNIREVSLEDLLSRDPIKFDWSALAQFVSGKKILITGGGGSIGSELCRQIGALNPEQLIIIEHSEFNLYQIQHELNNKLPHLNQFGYLVSITDREAVDHIFNNHQPDYVFHAAAYKHVPLLENQVKIAIKNNIFGTQTVANAAIKHSVKKFVLVSTDKAVNPTNVMGATKRCAELLCHALNKSSQTSFITVRFGNVLGSAGSVIPLFCQQIAKRQPLTVTHPEITRFFMTIPEAAQLIMQATVMGKKDDLFILDMGEPVKIQYLAEQMIRLSGLIPHKDIKIVYTGLRAGEKLYEELFYNDEECLSTQHEKIKQSHLPILDHNFMDKLDNLERSINFENNINLKLQLFSLIGLNKSSSVISV